eukprot:6457290-Amphidinium_carterae.1
MAVHGIRSCSQNVALRLARSTMADGNANERKHDNSDVSYSYFCAGMLQSASSSSTATEKSAVRGVWGWKSQNGQCVGQVRRDDTWQVNTLSVESAELVAIGELLLHLHELSHDDDVEVVMNSHAVGFHLLFSSFAARESKCIAKLKRLLDMVKSRRQIFWRVDGDSSSNAFLSVLRAAMNGFRYTSPMYKRSQDGDRLYQITGNQELEKASEKSCHQSLSNLVCASCQRFDAWDIMCKQPSVHANIGQGRVSWGYCGSLATYNLNKLP